MKTARPMSLPRHVTFCALLLVILVAEGIYCHAAGSRLNEVTDRQDSLRTAICNLGPAGTDPDSLKKCEAEMEAALPENDSVKPKDSIATARETMNLAKRLATAGLESATAETVAHALMTYPALASTVDEISRKRDVRISRIVPPGGKAGAEDWEIAFSCTNQALRQILESLTRCDGRTSLTGFSLNRPDDGAISGILFFKGGEEVRL